MSKKTIAVVAGFQIEEFGKGRNAIQSKYINEIVDALNKLGRITIERGDINAVAYSENGLTLKIKKDSASGASALTVQEIDGTPSVTSVSTIRFPNGSVTNIGGGIAQVDFAAATVDLVVCNEGTETTYRLYGAIVP